MQGLGLGILHTPLAFHPSKKLTTLPSCPALSTKPSLRCRQISRSASRKVQVQASNVSIGSGGYEDSEENKNKKIFPSDAPNNGSSEIEKPPVQIPYPLSVGLVLLGCALVFALIAFVKGGPSTLLAAIAKSGFTAAFSLIFVSEIGDKTFFIAALLAMQYDKALPCTEKRRWKNCRKTLPEGKKERKNAGIGIGDSSYAIGIPSKQEADNSSKLSRPFHKTLMCRQISRSASRKVQVQASNVSIGSGGYEDSEENKNKKIFPSDAPNNGSSEIEKPPVQIPYPLSVGLVLLGCALVFALIAFVKGGPSTLLAAIAKSGFTAAFSLIFVSEIGDKTFFIAALLAMQYDKALVLLGSTGALTLMTVLSVIIGRIFNSVPAQFQTTLPIGEYAAVTLLLFFGLKSIKDAWDLPSSDVKSGDKSSPELDEYTEAEELVKEKVSKRLTNPFEIVWKSFTLVFVAEWGDRSMLATIALGAAQSPWGVASGATAGHVLATSIAVLGGAFLANYISEKLVGYVGGGLFLVFAVATFFGVF
ncbi:hypothetical protein C1H46_036239 [Malus baccata]|uniref:GDT1 family protein n=1 Tax=Malus baccata TaxID=106549 RepID=A0A540KVF3_MALBA|nr:hypothetical protein C1H46_036239 [Malus baccata]